MWKEYREAKIHLNTAATITNIAIGFARRIESELLATFPKLRNWEDVVARMLPPLAQPDVKLGAGTDHLSNSTLFPLFQQLSEFRAIHRHHQDLSMKSRRPSTSRGSSQEYRKSGRKQSNSSGLDGLLMGAILLQMHNKTLPTQDELVHGLKGVLAGDTISLWVLFGLQLVTNILQVTGMSLHKHHFTQ